MHERTDWSDHNCETQYCFNVFKWIAKKMSLWDAYVHYIKLWSNNWNKEKPQYWELPNECQKHSSTDPRIGCQEILGDSQPFFY